MPSDYYLAALKRLYARRTLQQLSQGSLSVGVSAFAVNFSFTHYVSLFSSHASIIHVAADTQTSPLQNINTEVKRRIRLLSILITIHVIST